LQAPAPALYAAARDHSDFISRRPIQEHFSMVKVKVDVTGLYFRKEVSVDANSSVRDVMDAVQSDLNFPQLKYKAGVGNLFCSRIEIRH
jgi:hypothetical protein